jgi:hypothetical protein
MYIQEDCFTKQNLLDYTEEKIEKMSTPEKLFFWSKTQFPLLNDSRKKRILFISNAKIQLKLRENGPVKIPVFSRPGGIKHKPR